MGLLIYLDDLKGSSVVARESANSFKDKLTHAIRGANAGETDRLNRLNVSSHIPEKAPEPHILTLQGWHKSPLVIIRPLERIIYFVEQPDRELQEMMDHQQEVSKQRRDMMKDNKLVRPN